MDDMQQLIQMATFLMVQSGVGEPEARDRIKKAILGVLGSELSGGGTVALRTIIRGPTPVPPALDMIIPPTPASLAATAALAGAQPAPADARLGTNGKPLPPEPVESLFPPKYFKKGGRAYDQSSGGFKDIGTWMNPYGDAMVTWLRLTGKQAFVDAATGEIKITGDVVEAFAGQADVPVASPALTEIGGPTTEGHKPW